MIKALGWYWFTSGKEDALKKDQCGKWMFFFRDQQFAIDICEKAIEQGIVYECKCSDLELQGETGVTCFYLNGDDQENHRRVIQFMLDNNLIRKTKSGKLFNISFKYDNQTRAGEYGKEFESNIKLDQFLNLETGEWK